MARKKDNVDVLLGVLGNLIFGKPTKKYKNSRYKTRKPRNSW